MAFFPFQTIPVTRLLLCFDQSRNGLFPCTASHMTPEWRHNVDAPGWKLHGRRGDKMEKASSNTQQRAGGSKMSEV